MRYKGLGGSAGLLLLLGSAAGLAAAPPPAAALALSFDEAITLADRAPAVTAAQRSARVKRQLDARISRQPYNPQLGLQLGYRRELVEAGVDAVVSVAQGFNLDGYGAARLRSAHAEEATLDAEAAAARLRQRLLSARSWTVLWGATTAQREAAIEVDLMSEFLARIERGAQAGAYIQVDVTEARAYLAEARLQALTVEGEVFELGLELARSVGRAADLPLAPDGPLPEPVLPALSTAVRDHLLALAGELPEPRARRLLSEGERLRAAETRAQRGTQLALGAQWVHEPSAPSTILGTLTLQLPVFDHGERERADALASAERLHGAAADALLSARTELVAALHELEHSREIWEHLTDSMLPASETNLRLRERLLQAGEGTVLEVLLARRSLAAIRGRAARARAALSFARYKLWLYSQQLGITDATLTGGKSPAEGPDERR